MSSASFTGSIPEIYDRHLGPVFFDPYAADLAARVDPAAVPILEIASGTGRLTEPLRRRLDAAPVTAMDLNTAMQAVARSRSHDRRVRLVTGDAGALPFGRGAFAQAVCQFGVMFFPDKARAASEAHRVLCRGGTYLFNVWGSLAENVLADVTHRTVARFFTADPPAFYQVPFGYSDRDRILADLRAGGFISVDITTADLLGPCESARHIATGLVAGTPMAAAINERATVPADQIVDAVAGELEARFGTGAFSAPMRAHVVRARA